MKEYQGYRIAGGIYTAGMLGLGIFFALEPATVMPTAAKIWYLLGTGFVILAGLREAITNKPSINPAGWGLLALAVGQIQLPHLNVPSIIFTLFVAGVMLSPPIKFKAKAKE